MDATTNALRSAMDSLRAHLPAEERYLLSAKLLGDDLVAVDAGG